MRIHFAIADAKRRLSLCVQATGETRMLRRHFDHERREQNLTLQLERSRAVATLM
jgi:hypothetical protein